MYDADFGCVDIGVQSYASCLCAAVAEPVLRSG